jgi:signal transduction histidine kinase/ActR/RegA family two-component response regulator
MKRYGIRQQVAWLTFVPLFIMAISMETYFLHDRFLDMDKDLLDQGELIAHQLASASEYGVFSNNQAFLQNVAGGTLQQKDMRAAAILNPTSEVLASAGEFSLPLKSEIIGKILVSNERFNQRAFASFDDLNHAIILLPSANSRMSSMWLYHAIIPAQVTLDDGSAKTMEKPVGAVILEISRVRHEEHKTRMLWTTLSATALFLVLAFYLVHLASRNIVVPIRRLSKAVQEIGEGKLDTRISLETPVLELATLAQGLNESTARLQQERASLQYRVDEATQALREKKEEAERASQGKSHFLAVASHDLRQPLHALGLYVAELERRLSGTGQQHLIEQVGHSIEALSALLNALLDISKLDAGVVIPQIQSCNMATILERVAADYRMLAGQKNIRLIVRPFHGHVSSDPQLLERILMNLISNAIRYTLKDGCVLIACRKRGANLRIEVRDNGVGIPEADQENIFREFYQISQSQLGANKGLGLGLSIVDRLAKLLGHRIDLCSKPGMGSLFALELPIADGAQNQHADIQASDELGYGDEKSPLSGKKLLVVDDDMAVLSGTASLLRSWGCTVSQADSFVQVEQLLRSGEVWDFIVSDYQLGRDKNGVNVIDLVRQNHNRPIPSILISGDTSPAVLQVAGANGLHLLQKPVKPGKLRSLIVYLLEHHRDSINPSGCNICADPQKQGSDVF